MSKLPSFDRIDVIGRKTAKVASFALGAVMLALLIGLCGAWSFATPILIGGVAGLALAGFVFRRLLALEQAKVLEFARSYRMGDVVFGLR